MKRWRENPRLKQAPRPNTCQEEEEKTFDDKVCGSRN
jgi:hypothetical protein